MAGYGGKKGNGAGIGGPAQGSLYGGPANGAQSKARRAKPFDTKSSAAAHLARWGRDPSTMSRAELRMARTESMEDRLYVLAMEAEHEATQVAANKALHAIYNGTPVASIQHSGPDGGPLQSIGVVTNDPIEAAKVYQKMMGGQA